MTSSAHSYRLGAAQELERERPTLGDLLRARARVIRDGDRRRAAAYDLVIRHRVARAQAQARADR
jgi:hypothetical protein